MTISISMRLVVAFWATLFAGTTAATQLPTAPEPHLAPRKAKPGSVESLIDDLTDYQDSGKRTFEPLGEKERGEAAYRKLVELGFDAVPALLDAVKDKRLTPHIHWSQGWNGFFGPQTFGFETHVGQLAGEILNELSGRELADETGPQWIDAKKAREWWAKARKEGEEKWLVAHLESENGVVTFNAPPANAVMFRAVGAKYPNRLSEFYRTVLVKQPEGGSWVLAEHVAASKLPRDEKLALLVEGAEHKRLIHRNAALAVLADLDAAVFRKHLLATLKRLPPDVEMSARGYPQAELASLLWKTADPACWEALAALTRQSPVKVRIEIIRKFQWNDPSEEAKRIRCEVLRFLLRFLSDESADGPPVKREDLAARNCRAPPERVQDCTADTLAIQLGIKHGCDLLSGPVSRLFIRAAVAKTAAEELERLKK